MQISLTWVVPITILIGAVMGAALTLLIIQLAKIFHYRRRNFHKLSPDLQYTIEQLPLTVLIFDSSLTLLGSNKNPDSMSPRINMLQETKWMTNALREVRATRTPSLHASTASEPYWINVYPLEKELLVVLIQDKQDEYDTENLRREFIENMSHELNTPVTSIILLVEALSKIEGLPPSTPPFLESLLQETHRLTHLTKDISELSHAENALSKSNLVPIDVHELVKEVIANDRTYAKSLGVELVTGKTSGTLTILGSHHSLNVALANLVENAIQHSPSGAQVSVGVSQEHGNIHISVYDQGQGIPADEQEKIFKRFYRRDSARSRKLGGTGLGLAIARNTARSLNGDVTVWSELGVGSTFTMILPEYVPPS